MMNHKQRATVAIRGWLPGVVAMVGSLAIGGAAAGQELAHETSAVSRRITLEEALQQAAAAAADNPQVRLAQLQVEVAKQNRLGARSGLFPQVGTSFENFHFNKFMGDVIDVRRGPLDIGLPLLGQNQTFLALTVTQPITPILQLRHLYDISVADERIAMAKAGVAASENANDVETAFYELLVAQRHLALARMDANSAEKMRVRVASNSAAVMPVASVSDEEAMIVANHAVVTATVKVRELTASLNDLLGWPTDTELEPMLPNLRFAVISPQDATEKALAANPAVIEAAQNVVKAREAVTLQKLSYVPVIAVMGGWAHNGEVVPLLPNDFAFVGIVGTYNIFDFGKREHTIKAASTQAQMAETALELTKAKVAASVKAAYLDLQRSQLRSELAHRLDSAIQVQRTSLAEDTAESIAAKRIRTETESLQADLDYRQALARLKSLMGGR
jgi:outer membrane protein TolC